MKTTSTLTLTADNLQAEIMREAKAAKIPEGSAEKIAEKITERVLDWAQRRAAVTEADLNRKIAAEAAEYHKDLAFIFAQRGKII